MTRPLMCTGVHCDPKLNQFLQFDVPGSDPLGVIEAVGRAAQRAVGNQINEMCMSPGMLELLFMHPLVRDRIPVPVFTSDADWAETLGKRFGVVVRIDQVMGTTIGLFRRAAGTASIVANLSHAAGDLPVHRQ